MIPIAIARKIHNARNRSSHPRLLNAEVLEAVIGSSSEYCFSGSDGMGVGEGTTSSEGRTLGIFYIFWR